MSFSCAKHDIQTDEEMGSSLQSGEGDDQDHRNKQTRETRRLPPGCVVIGDAAYIPTEHMAPIFFGVDNSQSDYDNFNFDASQWYIRIEASFGILGGYSVEGTADEAY